MSAGIGSIVAAVAASACCFGPVLFAALGFGALGATFTHVAPYRPWLVALTSVLLGIAFYGAYRRPISDVCNVDGKCSASSVRRTRMVLWVVTIVVALVATFPYYVEWLV